MKKQTTFFRIPYKWKWPLVVIVIIFAIIVGFSIQQVQMLSKAHSTFENYYAFRGCVQLQEKTADYGICKTDRGDVIKIVKFHDKWYLDGDLPCGFLCF